MTQVTYTINSVNLSEFTTGFIAAVPVPTDSDDKPIMTETEWIKEWGKRNFIRAYQKGKRIIAEQSRAITQDIIT